jgi:hypothetical protein
MIVVDAADSVVSVGAVPVLSIGSLLPLLDELVVDVDLVVAPEGFSGGEVWIVNG